MGREGRESRGEEGRGRERGGFVRWEDVLVVGINVLYGEAMVGKTRQALALALKYKSAGWQVIYINTEVNFMDMVDKVREKLGIEVRSFLYPFDLRDFVDGLWRNRNSLSKVFIVLDSIGGVRENFRALFGRGTLADTAQVNLFMTRLIHKLAIFALMTDSIVLAVTHESRAIGRLWHGEDGMPTTTLHASHDAMSIVRMQIIENRDEVGNLISVERIARIIEHRTKPELVGKYVELLEPPL
jgi:hypothetical protein